MRSVTPVLLCACVLGRARVAPAEEIRLVYQAPPGCPDELSFWNELTARSPAQRTHREARTFTVSLDQGPEGVRGVLAIRERDGRSTLRHVDGATCLETAKALALVAALALEEAAREGAPVPPTSPPPLSPVRPPPPEAPRPWSIGAGVHLGASAGAAPAPLIGVPLFVEIAPAPELRIRAHLIRAYAEKAIMPDERLDFESTVGRLDACAFQRRFLGRFTALPCLTLEAGGLRVRASGVDDARDRTRPWVAPGVAGRLAVRAWRALWLEVEGNTTFPLIRDRFYLAPETTIHQVPLVTVGVSAGVAVVFP
jgi:hypothetical protein